jgi:hypothetical protein
MFIAETKDCEKMRVSYGMVIRYKIEMFRETPLRIPLILCVREEYTQSHVRYTVMNLSSKHIPYQVGLSPH